MNDKPYGHIGGYSVCMGCTYREVGCHSVCTAYLSEVENNAVEAMKKRKYNQTTMALHHLDRPKTYRRLSNAPQRNHMK